MRTPLASLLAFVLAAEAFADPTRSDDRLVLKSGRELVGTIVSRGGSEVVIRTASGSYTFSREQIARVEPAVRTPEIKAAPKPKVEMDPEALAALRGRVLVSFGNANPVERLRAAGEVIASWPASEPVLDEALRSPILAIRLDAVRLLEERELGDTSARVLQAMADDDATVRVAAIRIVRHRQLLGFQPALSRAVETDGAWSVRREALRTLEDMGTIICLRPVLSGFAAEHDETKRLAYRRVLRTLTGADCGDDLEKWTAAVEAAIAKTRRAARAN
jgi:hypothetical protein